MHRAAFVTIGQSPRDDLVPEMRSWIGEGLDIVERGLLDGMTRKQIESGKARGRQSRLVTRVRDGSEIVLGKPWVRDRLRELLMELEAEPFRFVVLLCTGRFPGLRSRQLLLEAQAIVDQGAAAICREAGSVGILVPLPEQRKEVRYSPGPGQRLMVTYASPYRPGRLEQAAKELSGAEIVLMDCMGYSEAMRRVVAEVTRRPVLLARRLVASAVAQLI